MAEKPKGLIHNMDPRDVAHWDRVRAQIRAGEPIVERRPPRTLEEQADKQITRLTREIAEWEEIKRRPRNASRPPHPSASPTPSPTTRGEGFRGGAR